MKDLGRIRRWYYRDGMSISAIVKKSGYARNTVKAWLKAAEGTEPTYRRRAAQDTKIGPYAAQLSKALEADSRRPQRDRRTALQLFREIQAEGFDGDYSRVTAFVRQWKADGGQTKVQAYVLLAELVN